MKNLTKTDTMILDAIRSRQEIPQPLISLRKLIHAAGLPDGYLQMAADRFCDEELIDGTEVLMDYTDLGDLLLTSGGVMIGREILESYVSSRDLTYVFKLLCSSEYETNTINNLTAMLRGMSIKDLIAYILQAEPEQRRLYACELRQRMPWTQTAHKARTAAQEMRVRWKYRSTYAAVKAAAKSITAEQD